MSKAKYKFSEEDLKELLSECVEQFDQLGIKHYKIDSIRFGNFRSANAECVQTIDYNDNVSEEIVVCKRLVREDANCTRNDLKILIMHEIIHSVVGEEILAYNKTTGEPIYRNLSHGRRWNEIAKEIERNYPEYNFFSGKSYDDIVYPDVPVKYIYCCPVCGSVERIRKTEISSESRCFFCGTEIKAKKPDSV